ncbi:iron-containing redox enzyme family protein [Salinibacterium sp. ZJ450]|uniref:iron-containing redox enzyme family protein n=1 Tax=Salinibacterium sp. ZJ450 TaxID=2708338 RepID=UPI00141EE264|nr:iron-containing redox enzyme family protein [Salinibacterium sp. ZJ450]
METRNPPTLATPTPAAPTPTTPTRAVPAPLFHGRGPVSELLIDALPRPRAEVDAALAGLTRLVEQALAATSDILRDDDLQLALLILYGLHYGSLVETDGDWEWHPATLAARLTIEEAFERELRQRIAAPELPQPTRETVAAALFELTGRDTGPSLSRYVAREASREQLIELVVQKSVYTLKEADAQTWAIPRLRGRAKAGLVEIQADEYGGGRPERMHAAIYAGTMRGVGLDDRYGAYLDQVSAITLASFNLMTMFGLNRRLRGASVGHFAAFEMTSSVPNRFYANGFRRHGYGDDVTWYFDEHVEADAVHEQLAAREVAGSLAEDEPALLGDIFFGAAACLTVDGWVGEHILNSWTAGQSSLRMPLDTEIGGAA